jgi:hypothetical protein
MRLLFAALLLVTLAACDSADKPIDPLAECPQQPAGAKDFFLLPTGHARYRYSRIESSFDYIYGPTEKYRGKHTLYEGTLKWDIEDVSCSSGLTIVRVHELIEGTRYDSTTAYYRNNDSLIITTTPPAPLRRTRDFTTRYDTLIPFEFGSAWKLLPRAHNYPGLMRFRAIDTNQVLAGTGWGSRTASVSQDIVLQAGGVPISYYSRVSQGEPGASEREVIHLTLEGFTPR